MELVEELEYHQMEEEVVAVEHYLVAVAVELEEHRQQAEEEVVRVVHYPGEAVEELMEHRQKVEVEVEAPEERHREEEVVVEQTNHH
jgi:hypothetical protein